LNRPDGISDTEGRLIAGNREQAPKRASFKVPDNPPLLPVFCGDRPVVVPDSCPFASIPGPHFYLRKLRGEVLEKFLDTARKALWAPRAFTAFRSLHRIQESTTDDAEARKMTKSK
jgi:hypothetical protein